MKDIIIISPLNLNHHPHCLSQEGVSRVHWWYGGEHRCPPWTGVSLQASPIQEPLTQISQGSKRHSQVTQRQTWQELPSLQLSKTCNWKQEGPLVPDEITAQQTPGSRGRALTHIRSQKDKDQLWRKQTATWGLATPSDTTSL